MIKVSPVLKGVVAALISLVLGLGAIEMAQWIQRQEYQDALTREAQRRAIEIMAHTLNGNIMGAVSAVGLLNRPLKEVLTQTRPLDDPTVLDTLSAIGKAYDTTSVFIVNQQGIVQSSWDGLGKPNTGLDIRFRPYFKIALQGQQNVYAAVGLSKGLRSLYFAAPLYQEVSTQSPVKGVIVGRLGVEPLETFLNAWPDPAFLLSPQQVTFASNRSAWNMAVTADRTADHLKAIRALKQFGHRFDQAEVLQLPFRLKDETVQLNGQLYALAQASVEWNDPNGAWTLVLLSNLKTMMPASQKFMIGGLAGGMSFILMSFFLYWRHRLHLANEARHSAQIALENHAKELEHHAHRQTFLAELSTELYQAHTLIDFANKTLLHLMPKLGQAYGAFYIEDAQEGDLRPIGAYGVQFSSLDPSLKQGQGWVGQCAKQQIPLSIRASEEGIPISIELGGGSLAIEHLTLFPLLNTQKTLGVLVIGGLTPLDPEALLLLKELFPLLALRLEILGRNPDAKLC